MPNCTAIDFAQRSTSWQSPALKQRDWSYEIRGSISSPINKKDQRSLREKLLYFFKIQYSYHTRPAEQSKTRNALIKFRRAWLHDQNFDLDGASISDKNSIQPGNWGHEKELSRKAITPFALDQLCLAIILSAPSQSLPCVSCVGYEVQGFSSLKPSVWRLTFTKIMEAQFNTEIQRMTD